MNKEQETVDPVVKAIAVQLPEVTTEQVAAVMEVYYRVTQGAPLGTIVQEPGTGNVAYRVSEGGVHMWSVVSPKGGMWKDMNPGIPAGWRTVASGEAAVSEPTTE